VSVIDVVKHLPVQTIEIGPQGEIKPMSIVLSPDATKAYVSSGRGKRVFVIDTMTNMVTSSLEVGERPWGIALSPDGKFLYTANGPSNDVSVVDLGSNKVIKKINVGTGPWGVITLAPR
jgi:YVTN family beta-propeller protein